MPVDRVCLDTFRQLESRLGELGDGFSLLKSRIEDISTYLVLNDEASLDKQEDEEDKVMKQDEEKA